MLRGRRTKADLACVIDAGPVNMPPGSVANNPANTESKGDWRAHVGMQLAF